MKKLIVITGISRGLGLAMTEKFIEQGHTVCGCARSTEATQKLEHKFGTPHHFASIDVADEHQVKTWSEQILNNYSFPDLLINHAALINQPAPLWKVDSAEFSRLIDVNIKGVANVIRSFVLAMIEKNSCNIHEGTSPQTPLRERRGALSMALIPA